MRRLLLIACLCGCGDDAPGDTGDAGTGSPDQVGQACEAPADCYSGVDQGELVGAVECLDRVQGGYCTHECTGDEDCCAVEGECLTPWPQVCSPFESTGQMLCFLSCESSDVGDEDEQAFCQREASPDFICRSSGGGPNNRKVCVPGDCGVGAACDDGIDCADGLDCIADAHGGYCGRAACASNDDCPEDTVCIEFNAGSICARHCETEADCSFCRHPDAAASCRTDVTYLGGAETVPVCVPGVP